MTRLLVKALGTAAILLLALSPVSAQDGFYRGKTVRVIVGASAGGGAGSGAGGVKKGEVLTVIVRAVQDAGLDVQVGDDGAVGLRRL